MRSAGSVAIGQNTVDIESLVLLVVALRRQGRAGRPSALQAVFARASTVYLARVLFLTLALLAFL